MEPDAHLIGRGLRAERERLGLTLKHAEAETRIRARYLAALEDERFDELPGEAYARGFLRSYASFLGLDGNAYLTAYRARSRAAEPPIAPVPVRPPRAQPRWAVAAAAAAAAVAALGFGAWKLDGRGDDPRAAAEDAAREALLFAQRAAPTPAPAPAAPARPAPAPLVLRAAGGECRLEVRIGGPGGRLAWSGTLREGRTLRLGLARALFVKADAPENLRATIGAQPQKVQVGAYGFVATPKGIQPRD